MLARTGEELLKICEEESISLSEYAIRIEMRDRELSREEVYKKMAKNLKVMKEGATEGREKQVNSLSGLIGGDGYRVQKYLEKGNTLTGDITVKAMAMALSSSEVNASMGRIVACPTAGSCGILPAVILSAGEKLGKSDEELIDALFASAAVGMIIGMNATLSGAEGGCQAECGSAAAMGAAAVVEMMGGTPKMSLDAAAIVIKNVLGLVCDPVAEVNDDIRKIVDDMFDTMYQEEGIGLAAPQVDILQRIITIDIEGDKQNQLVLINPEILASEGETGIEEGCLSIPGFRALVPRKEKVTVKALDRHGKEFTLDADGLLAICIQHEIDHLNGILFVDYLSPLKRQRIKEKLVKYKKQIAKQ